MRLGRLVGGCECFSKVKCRLVCVVGLFGFYWSFINGFKRGFSPASLGVWLIICGLGTSFSTLN